MLYRWSFINLLSAFVLGVQDLVEQSHVPVLLFSHNLTPELHKYLGKFDNSLELLQETFFEAARELVDGCKSSAYVLINQPGLRKDDLVEYHLEYASLERYISHSSTAVALEQMEALPEDTFEQLTEYIQERCRIDHVLYVEGDNLDSFQPYIDVDKRVICIDFPPLPEDQDLRRQAISASDTALRKTLAQIPSPARSLIYTSLQPATDVRNSRGRIFPHIFQDKNRELLVERNNHLLDIPPHFNEYRPKFMGMSGEYLSIFDEKFVRENKQLLVAIVTGLVGFIILQLMSRPKPKAKTQPKAVNNVHANLSRSPDKDGGSPISKGSAKEQ